MEKEVVRNGMPEMDLSKLPLTKKILAMNGGVCGTRPISDYENELAQLRVLTENED
jgi:hypothetical protein